MVTLFLNYMEEKMRKGCFLLIWAIAMFLIFTGCVGPSRLEIDYGTSHKLSKFNQILDPEAEKNLEPVMGFDGKAAKSAVEKYQKDFEKASLPPTYILGIQSTSK